MMQHRLNLSALASILIVLGIGLYLYLNRDLLIALSNLSLKNIGSLITLRFLFLLTNGLFLQAFTAKFDIQLTAKEIVGIPIITTMSNYLLPFSGGMVARAAYLKHRHAFPYTQFLVLLTANYLVNFWVISLIGLIAILITSQNWATFWPVLPFFLMTLSGISAFVLLPIRKFSDAHRFTKWTNQALMGWAFIKNDKRLLFKLLVFTLMNILTNGLSFWLAYQAIGVSITFTTTLLISLLSVFSILINITPGNLGIQELVVGLSAILLGVDGGEGVLANLVVRVTTLLLTFSLGPVFSYLLTQELQNTKDWQRNSVDIE